MSNLLASSSSIEGIQKLISKYYCGSTITLNQLSSKEWDVSTGKGLCENVRVRNVKNRFRFEIKDVV